jgi:hypothetical protein
MIDYNNIYVAPKVEASPSKKWGLRFLFNGSINIPKYNTTLIARREMLVSMVSRSCVLQFVNGLCSHNLDFQ